MLPEVGVAAFLTRPCCACLIGAQRDGQMWDGGRQDGRMAGWQDVHSVGPARPKGTLFKC